MNTLYPASLVRAEYEDRDDLDRQMLIDDFQADAQAAYDSLEKIIGREFMRQLERQVLMTVLDRKWREHLYEMDYLREGIGLRAMAQRDPLVEYQREGADMFNAMLEAFIEEVVSVIFHIEFKVPSTAAVNLFDDEDSEAGVVVQEPVAALPKVKAKGLAGAALHTPLSYSAPAEDGTVRTSSKTVSKVDNPYANVGRNAPCPCGSGKKFKMCHGRPGAA
jgi:preprotein translocase subunit SecA